MGGSHRFRDGGTYRPPDPDKVAVVYGERRITYGDLVSDSRRLALGLLELGLKPLDRAVIQLPNIPEFVTTYLALNWIGVIPVMALRAHRHAEVRHFIRASGATAYFIADTVADFDYRPMAAEMAAEFPFLRHVVVAGKQARGKPRWPRWPRRPTGTLAALSRCARSRRGLDHAAVRRHDLALQADSADP